MYGEQQFKAYNYTIHEDIGSINYVFADKTGTLTKNELTFRGCSIASKLYEDFRNQLYSSIDTDMAAQSSIVFTTNGTMTAGHLSESFHSDDLL